MGSSGSGGSSCEAPMRLLKRARRFDGRSERRLAGILTQFSKCADCG